MNDSGPRKERAAVSAEEQGLVSRVRVEGLTTAVAEPLPGEADDPFLPGTCVGRFVLERKLGEGGMGVVFAARDPDLQRVVAVKILRPVAAHSEGTEAQQRMLREAQAMAMLSHPNLVTIYEVGTYEDDVFLAMEYVVGQSLDRWLRAGQVLEDVLEVFMQAGRALQAVHDAGLVHRDFKPANVMVGEDGVAKVLDLGIARKTESRASEQAQEPMARPSGVEPKLRAGAKGADAFEQPLTEQGAIVGTPSYMSPEQLRGEEVGPQSDQFSFAVSLFEALCGYRPFGGSSHLATMTRILTGEMKAWPNDSEVPRALRQVIGRALATKATDRFATMNALLDACQNALGLRGQIRFLTARWHSQNQHEDYLLPEGALLREGRFLLAHHPEALSDEQRVFVERSASAARKKLIHRRALLWGFGAATLGFVPSVWLLRRRSRQLERATMSGVRASIDTVREKVDRLFAAAETDIRLMFAQRYVWLPDIDDLIASAELDPSERDRRLTHTISRLNRFFRPVVQNTPVISSLMVARDDGFEFLVFDDPDAGRLAPPYRFYNRVVQRRAYGKDAYQVFWPARSDAPPRAAWLRAGGTDSRGQTWDDYDPTVRPWFVDAIDEPQPRIVWTKPYLFFVTKDAGITGSIAFHYRGHRYVLAVDFMLTDLSAITAGLEDDQFWAMVTTGGGKVVGLPKDPRFRTAEDIRDFFSRIDGERRRAQTREKLADASAELPDVGDLDNPMLSAAFAAAADASTSVFSFEHQAGSYWAGRRRIASAEQDLTLYIVERP